MIPTEPKMLYVNPQQLQHQREYKDEARKSVAPNSDPARVIAEAWQTSKLGLHSLRRVS